MELQINKNSHKDYRIVNYFANKSNDFYFLLFTVLSTLGIFISYNRWIKLIYEIFILFALLFFVLKKPEIVIPIFFLTSVAPVRIYTGIFSIDVTFIVLDNYTIIVLGLLFVFLIKLLLDKQIRIKGMIPFIIIVFLMILSYFYTDAYTRSTYYTGGFWCILLYYLIVPVFIKDRNNFNTMLKGYIYAIFQAAILIIYSMLFIVEENPSIEFYDGNYFSAYLILLIATVMIYLLTNKNVKKIFSILAIVSIFPCIIQIFQSASRTAFICLILLCLLYIIINIRKLKNIIFLIIIFAFFMLFIYDPEFTEALFERFQGDDVTSGNGRLDIAISMLEHFSGRPIFEKLFGTGYNSVFLFVYGSYYTPHNSFIGFLMHYGLFGIIAFVYILINAALKLLKSKNYKPYLIFVAIFSIYCITLEPHIKAEFIFIYIGLFSILTSRNRLNAEERAI